LGAIARATDPAYVWCGLWDGRSRQSAEKNALEQHFPPLLRIFDIFPLSRRVEDDQGASLFR